MFLFQLSYRYLQIPEKSSAAVSKIRSGKTVSRANFNPTHFKHILQVTPAVWVKTNLNRALQLILTPAPAPGTSPLLPTLLTQKDTYQLKSGFKGHICSRVSLIHPSLTCTTRALLCPILSGSQWPFPWLAPFIGPIITILFFLLATCLLISLRNSCLRSRGQ